MNGQLLLILIVALVVFGPKKLPMLASNLGHLMHQLQKVKQQLWLLWHQQQQASQLQENIKRAQAVDSSYQQNDI